MTVAVVSIAIGASLLALEMGFAMVFELFMIMCIFTHYCLRYGSTILTVEFYKY